MLSENELQRLARLVRLAEYMSQEQREGLFKLIHDLRAAEGAGWMPQSAIQPMVDAVGDQQVRDIVNDLRGGRAEPGWIRPPAKRLEEMNKPDAPKDDTPSYLKPDKGWVKERGSMAQTEIFDEMVSALAGGPNDTSKLK